MTSLVRYSPRKASSRKLFWGYAICELETGSISLGTSQKFLVLESVEPRRGPRRSSIYHWSFSGLFFCGSPMPIIEHGLLVVDFATCIVHQYVRESIASALLHKGGSKKIIDLRYAIAQTIHQEMEKSGIGNFHIIIEEGYSLQYRSRPRRR